MERNGSEFMAAFKHLLHRYRIIEAVFERFCRFSTTCVFTAMCLASAELDTFCSLYLNILLTAFSASRINPTSESSPSWRGN